MYLRKDIKYLKSEVDPALQVLQMLQLLTALRKLLTMIFIQLFSTKAELLQAL